MTPARVGTKIVLARTTSSSPDPTQPDPTDTAASILMSSSGHVHKKAQIYAYK
jgi:hypothetical protein